MSPERLQKVLARAGFASRRDCEAVINAGRVAVNGRVVRVLGTRVDLDHDEVTVDGQPIGPLSSRTYVLLNKPAGVISTAEDTHERPTVVELVDLPVRLFPVGRLDQNSEGLLLLTDDGALTQRLTHPSYGVEKEYRALLDRVPSPEALREWRRGVELEGVRTAPAWVELQERTDEGAWVRVVLHEGRKRQIREVARLLGYEVVRLIRVREGPLALGDLPAGQWRYLTPEEVAALWEHVGGHVTDDEAQSQTTGYDANRAPRRSRRQSVDDVQAEPQQEQLPAPELGGEVRPGKRKRGAPEEAAERRAPQRDTRAARDGLRGPRRDERPPRERVQDGRRAYERGQNDRFGGPRREGGRGQREVDWARRERRAARPDGESARRADTRGGAGGYARSRRDEAAYRDDRSRGDRARGGRSYGRSEQAPGEYRDRARQDARSADGQRPMPGNERQREQPAQKRGPGRSWRAQQEREQRERRERSAPSRARRQHYPDRRSGAGRPRSSFRPLPDPDERDEG